MPFDINNFRANGLVYGGARPSLFEVEITPPSILGATATSQKLTFLARASQLPAMSIGTVEVPYFGRRIKLSGDRVYGDWSITVMNDEDFALRAMFEEWSNKMNKVISNVAELGPGGVGALTGYKTTALVRQFSKRGANVPGAEPAPIRTYYFEGIFPTTIDAIGLDWDQTNQIQSYGVTFSYDYWTPEAGANEPGSKAKAWENDL